MVQTKFGFNGEVLRKREITYIITGGDPRDFGYEMFANDEGELSLRKNGIVFFIGETGLDIGQVHITRKLGGIQQKDIGVENHENIRQNKKSIKRIVTKHT